MKVRNFDESLEKMKFSIKIRETYTNPVYPHRAAIVPKNSIAGIKFFSERASLGPSEMGEAAARSLSLTSAAKVGFIS